MASPVSGLPFGMSGRRGDTSQSVWDCCGDEAAAAGIGVMSMSLEEEVAKLKEKKRELERMLSPSYDTRKKLGETSDDSCIANEVQKEYYRYFQSFLHGVALRHMETTEKEAYRRQICELFLAIHDSCRKLVLSEIRALLKRAIEQMLEPRQGREPLTEDEFDIRRACGLLFLCIRANSIQHTHTVGGSSEPSCAHASGRKSSAEQPLPATGEENNHTQLYREKQQLLGQIEKLKQKQEQQLSMCIGGSLLHPEQVDKLRKSQEATIDRMISLLEHHLMTLPDESSHTGRKTQANDQFYSYQQAYGLLVSANGSLKDIPDKFGQIISDAHRLLGLHNTSDVSNSTVQSQSERAVKLAYRMFKCVPPLVVCQPVKYTPKWHEIMPAHWPDNLEGPYHLVYYQPVLLFTPYGPVAEKGQVGRTPSVLQQNCVNIAGDDSLLEDEVEDSQIERTPAYQASCTSTLGNESSYNQGICVSEHNRGGVHNSGFVANADYLSINLGAHFTEDNPHRCADGSNRPRGIVLSDEQSANQSSCAGIKCGKQ